MRKATRQDLPAIVAIYNATIPSRQSTADLVEVTIESKEAWFDQHTDQRPIMVQEEEGRVIAWFSFQPFYGRAAYNHSAEISIYIEETYRGDGLGRALLAAALQQAESLGIKTLLGFIFSHNQPSIRLFQSAGFETWGQLPEVAEMDGQAFSLTILGKRIRP